MRLILSCTGVLVVGVTSVARERGRERERESLRTSVSAYLVCPASLYVNVSVCVHVRVRLPLGRPWTSPFIDTRRCPAVQWGCSYTLTWLAEKCLEPCTCANVAIEEVP
jgi:hypothetical protein